MIAPREPDTVFAKLLSFYGPFTAEASPDADAMLMGTLALAHFVTPRDH